MASSFTPLKPAAAAVPSISPVQSSTSFPESGFPYCQRARQLLLELKRSPDWLPTYNEEGVRCVIEECTMLDDMINKLTVLLVEEEEEEEKLQRIKLSIQSFHLCICRNKRMLLAYFHHRNERIEHFYWETSSVVIPPEFAQKLSRQELDYYANFQHLVTKSMETMDMDLLSNRMPPGTQLFVNVRAMQDLGQVLLQSGASVFLHKNSTHYLRRDDVEHLIRQNLLQELV